MAFPLLRPFALLTLAAFLLAGCADDGAPTDDVAVPAPLEPAPVAELRNQTFSGSAYNIGTICFSDGGDFEEDVGGWDYRFESDVAASHVVWQDASEENMGLAEPGEGQVPDGAKSFYVCVAITEIPVVTEANYTLTVTEPAPAPAGNATAEADAA